MIVLSSAAKIVISVEILYTLFGTMLLPLIDLKWKHPPASRTRACLREWLGPVMVIMAWPALLYQVDRRRRKGEEIWSYDEDGED